MAQQQAARFFVGADVGTSSVRVGVVDAAGRVLVSNVQPITVHSPQAGFYEHSSRQIWEALCLACRTALAESGVAPAAVAAVGFDATCSLVAEAREGETLSVSPDGDPRWDVIVWQDHRAVAEAAELNRAGHALLRFAGGALSPEMQPPKLLWLKRHVPRAFAAARRFFDLADFLVFRATGDDARSQCTTTCKWLFRPGGWDAAFWEAAGLAELAADGCRAIGRRVAAVGEAVGRGVCDEAARELGLLPGTTVAAGLIDAHAGALALLNAPLPSGARSRRAEAGDDQELEQRMALICGTSTCHMSLSRREVFVPGVWGPYHSAVVPGLSLLEGGQSATGSLLAQVVRHHAYYTTVYNPTGDAAKAAAAFAHLEEALEALARERGLEHVALLARDVHVVPDFHGNRSPLADATRVGAVSGLRLLAPGELLADACVTLLATVQALAYGTRHILETLAQHGAPAPRVLLACGGLARSRLFLQTHADATGCVVASAAEEQAVLVGAAIAARCAHETRGLSLSESERGARLAAAMSVMGRTKEAFAPDAALRAFHEAKYRVFRAMQDDQRKYQQAMAAAAAPQR